MAFSRCRHYGYAVAAGQGRRDLCGKDLGAAGQPVRVRPVQRPAAPTAAASPASPAGPSAALPPTRRVAWFDQPVLPFLCLLVLPVPAFVLNSVPLSYVLSTRCERVISDWGGQWNCAGLEPWLLLSDVTLLVYLAPWLWLLSGRAGVRQAARVFGCLAVIQLLVNMVGERLILFPGWPGPATFLGMLRTFWMLGLLPAFMFVTALVGAVYFLVVPRPREGLDTVPSRAGHADAPQVAGGPRDRSLGWFLPVMAALVAVL